MHTILTMVDQDQNYFFSVPLEELSDQETRELAQALRRAPCYICIENLGITEKYDINMAMIAKDQSELHVFAPVTRH